MYDFIFMRFYACDPAEEFASPYLLFVEGGILHSFNDIRTTLKGASNPTSENPYN